ncbi:phosphate ABC transporter permease subunit PstC [Nitrosomonas sp.]|uniref:Phosphate transport system permease protein n=1 Tax=Nitrosomonas oligotropha TaxID=42354 RepID=A0A5C7VYQ4_9PROT|nr:phosphate ABC transporter permease subunit PstC [Nitrosomonas sp.]TXI29652.1 MAG: phosphate ABC transporter permease subunit PstC [Nitrosomonas oligotropha]MBV6446910.1 Phosphate transport system permease protein PstC 1 [Nitrosomonas sp.]HMV12982.1 phosphate ABC transporter permease subunit PstC [Nitrosomonas sp.]HMW20095.1 phosphate ABC transporter permease subunit PstC [Nitrosomonas sp.]HMW69553.1 phosphate ABC transporter permease subunit PstC [Nitrosomonas sp.]
MIWSKRYILFPLKLTDSLLHGILRVGAVISALVMLLILLFLIVESWPVLGQISPVRFFTDTSWHPLEGAYHLMPMLAGTLYASAGALLLAIPLGIASALFIVYYASPRLAKWYKRLVELLAGIPSVVFGFWGLTTLVPLINQLHPPGASLLAAILVLTLMILPTITLTAYSALMAVPVEFLRNAAALGLSRWGMIHGVAFPAARAGIVAGIILAMGRAIGETMAVLMVAGNVVQYPDGLFDPIRTLASNIVLEMAYAMGDHRAMLFVSGLLLMLMLMMLSGMAGWLGRSRCA